MPRSTLIGAAAALAALTAAGSALSQERPPLRRLDWAGRPATDPTAESRGARAVIPHAGVEPSRVALRPPQPWRPTRGGVDGRPGLTPASAFADAAPPPSWTPPADVAAPPPPRVERAPVAAPQPTRASGPAPRPAPAAPPPQRAPAPEPQPPRARLVQSSPVAPEARPTAAAEAPVDPMAPRSDAPIFRVQGARQPAAAVATPSSGAAAEPAPAQPRPAPQAAGPPRQQGARYYSVHRQNGRAPDPTVLPEPVWLDRMPVQLDSTPQSEDLAAPPETPQMVRGSDGRMRPVQGAQHDVIP